MKRDKFPQSTESIKGKNYTDELREKILNFSIQEFSKRGFSAVSLDEISRRLHISKKTIYRLFPTKRDLFIETVFSIFLGLTDKAIPIFNDSTLEPLQKISKIINTIYSYLSTVSPLILNDLKIYFPGSYKQFLDFREFMIQRYKGIFIEAQKKGLLRKDIKVDFVIDLMINVANSIITPDYIISRNTTIKEVLSNLLNIVLIGILKNKEAILKEVELK